MKSYYFEDKVKRRRKVTLILAPLVICFIYMIYAMKISRQVVLMESTPEWTTYISISVIAGCVYSFFHRGSRTNIIELFFMGFCAGFMCSLNLYSVCTALLPGDIVSYKSKYEIVYPGPYVGRFGSRCEAGLLVKEMHTQRWKQFCTNKKELDSQIKQGMDSVWVTVKANKIGAYIINYKFIYSSGMASK